MKKQSPASRDGMGPDVSRKEDTISSDVQSRSQCKMEDKKVGFIPSLYPFQTLEQGMVRLRESGLRYLVL